MTDYFGQVRNFTHQTFYTDSGLLKVNLSWTPPVENQRYMLPLVYFITMKTVDGNETNKFTVTNSVRLEKERESGVCACVT